MGPRLARLYSEDIRKLEARHAAALSPGATSWEEAVEQLYRRMVDAGPRKGVKLLRRAADYLAGVGLEERTHLVLACGGKGRNGALLFVTFNYGQHPDRKVVEEGLNINLHILHCSRSHPSCGIAIPVAFICRHALNRLFERGFDITDNSCATNVFSFIAVLAYLTHRCEKHVDGGLYLRFSSVLTAGSLHRFAKIYPSGRALEECVYDVRTILSADEIGPSRQHQLDQGTIAAQAVIEWFEDADDPDETGLAERIPALPRRQDHYPVRQAGLK